MNIGIHVQHAFRIGDALSHVPYMAMLCKRHNAKAMISGRFNTLVGELLETVYPFTFIDAPMLHGVTKRYTMNMELMLPKFGPVAHMSQSFFMEEGVIPCGLPIFMDLRTEPCYMQSGLVIAPFSDSNQRNNNKVWVDQRWVDTVQTLRRDGLVDRAYVLGAGHENVDLYANMDIQPVMGKPLAVVLDLLRQSHLVMTVDNGISHLVHYGGVPTHALLYPGCNPMVWAANPRARIVQKLMPIDVTVDDMVQAAQDALRFTSGA